MNRQEELALLIQSALQHYQEEYPKDKYLFAGKESYRYFRSYAQQKMQVRPPKPASRQAPRESSHAPTKIPIKRNEPKTVVKKSEPSSASAPAIEEPSFKLDPLASPPADSFADMRKWVAAALPNLKILDASPPCPKNG